MVRDDEAGLRRFHANALDDLDAGEARHAKVDEGYVGLELAELGDGFDPVSGFADDLDALYDIEERNQSLAHHMMIFYNENAYGFRASTFFPRSSPFSPIPASLDVATWSRTVVPVPISLVISSMPSDDVGPFAHAGQTIVALSRT